MIPRYSRYDRNPDGSIPKHVIDRYERYVCESLGLSNPQLKNKHCKKTSFSNEQYAEEYIEKLHRTSIKEKKPVSSYLCPKCLNWHLTSIKDAEVSKLREAVHRLTKDNVDRKKLVKKIEALERKNGKLERSSNQFKYDLERVLMKFKSYKEQVEKAIKKQTN